MTMILKKLDDCFPSLICVKHPWKFDSKILEYKVQCVNNTWGPNYVLMHLYKESTERGLGTMQEKNTWGPSNLTYFLNFLPCCFAISCIVCDHLKDVSWSNFINGLQ